MRAPAIHIDERPSIAHLDWGFTFLRFFTAFLRQAPESFSAQVRTWHACTLKARTRTLTRHVPANRLTAHYEMFLRREFPESIPKWQKFSKVGVDYRSRILRFLFMTSNASMKNQRLIYKSSRESAHYLERSFFKTRIYAC